MASSHSKCSDVVSTTSRTGAHSSHNLQYFKLGNSQAVVDGEGGSVVTDSVAAADDEGVVVGGVSDDGLPWAKLAWAREWLPVQLSVPQWTSRRLAGAAIGLDAAAFSARDFSSKEAVQKSARQDISLPPALDSNKAGTTSKFFLVMVTFIMQRWKLRVHIPAAEGLASRFHVLISRHYVFVVSLSSATVVKGRCQEGYALLTMLIDHPGAEGRLSTPIVVLFILVLILHPLTWSLNQMPYAEYCWWQRMIPRRWWSKGRPHG